MPRRNARRPPRLSPLIADAVYYDQIETVQCNRPDESTPVPSIAESHCACSAFLRCPVDGYSAMETRPDCSRAANLAVPSGCAAFLDAETHAAASRAALIHEVAWRKFVDVATQSANARTIYGGEGKANISSRPPAVALHSTTTTRMAGWKHLSQCKNLEFGRRSHVPSSEISDRRECQPKDCWMTRAASIDRDDRILVTASFTTMAMVHLLTQQRRQDCCSRSFVGIQDARFSITMRRTSRFIRRELHRFRSGRANADPVVHIQHPRGMRLGLPGGKNILYRNNGDGTFTDVSEKSGMWNTVGNYALSVAVADFNNDGWPDIYVANDSTAASLYQNQKDGTFKDIAIEAGAAFSPDGKPQAGMGVSVGDYNRDGNLDVVKTNFAGDTDSLYANLGDGSFEDQTYLSGLGVNTRYLGWGLGFFDMDNDGWLDIFVSNGHVYPEVSSSKTEAPYAEHKYLYRNLRNGRFEEVTDKGGPGITAAVPARGCAFGDYDNDGDLDIIVNCVNSLPQLLRCDSEWKRSWIKIKAIGTKSNPHRHRRAHIKVVAKTDPLPRSHYCKSTRYAAEEVIIRKATCGCTSASIRPRLSTSWRFTGPQAKSC